MAYENKKTKNEVSRQFDEIWRDWHDPEKRELRKLKENRERKAEIKKKELGLT